MTSPELRRPINAFEQNVRDLGNGQLYLERAAVLTDGQPLKISDLERLKRLAHDLQSGINYETPPEAGLHMALEAVNGDTATSNKFVIIPEAGAGKKVQVSDIEIAEDGVLRAVNTRVHNDLFALLAEHSNGWRITVGLRAPVPESTFLPSAAETPHCDSLEVMRQASMRGISRPVALFVGTASVDAFHALGSDQQQSLGATGAGLTQDK